MQRLVILHALTYWWTLITNQKLCHSDLVYWVYRSCAAIWRSLLMACLFLAHCVGRLCSWQHWHIGMTHRHSWIVASKSVRHGLTIVVNNKCVSGIIIHIAWCMWQVLYDLWHAGCLQWQCQYTVLCEHACIFNVLYSHRRPVSSIAVMTRLCAYFFHHF